MTAFVALALSLSGAMASPDMPEDVPEVDISAIAQELVVLDDGEGNLVAFQESEPRKAIWFGDREHMYAQQITGSFASGEERWDATILDFRSPTRRASVRMREGAFTMECGNDLERELTRIPDADAQKIAKKAVFHEHRWRRNAVAAYRDEWGVYYFIDRATGEDENVDHRVYIGWQGQILRAPLKLLASDSLGKVYAAGNGTRRLVITGDKARYIEGDERRELLALDVRVDGPFIYTQLGIYGDAPHGTPCDVLMPFGE